MGTQLPAAPAKKAPEGTTTKALRHCHHASGEHSASTQSKMKMSLDSQQGVTSLSALELQIHHWSQIPAPKEMSGIASLMSPGLKAGFGVY